MKKIYFISIVLVMVVLYGCSKSEIEKTKLDNVPDSAIWAGGVDGGNWFYCQEYDEAYKYKCTVYNDYNGAILAVGDFLFRKKQWSKEKRDVIYFDVESRQEIEYSFFDGTTIFLKKDFVLVPDGIIDYPFDENSGKNQLFKDGRAVGEAVSYNKVK